MVLHERYKLSVKVTRALVTLLGFSGAFFVFPSPWIALAFAFALHVSTSFFEKTAFRYVTFYVHPLPDAPIDSRHWTSVGFGYMTPREDPSIRFPTIFWIVEDFDTASTIHRLLFSWTLGETNDTTGAIKMTVVVRKDGTYCFYCYPNWNRLPAQIFQSSVESQAARTKIRRDDEHSQVVMHYIFAKTFKQTASSMLPLFHDNVAPGDPVIFRLAHSDSEGRPAPYDRLAPITVTTIEFKDVDALSRNDMEYDFENRPMLNRTRTRRRGAS